MAVFLSEVDPRQRMVRKICAASPEGRHLYGVENGVLAILERDAKTGVLTWVESLYDGLELLNGPEKPTHLALSPDGAHVYVVDASFDIGGAISTLRRDTDSGRLTLVQTLTANADVPALADPLFVRVSRDEHQVYVATSQGLVVLTRNPADGSLSFSHVEVEWRDFAGKQGMGRVVPAESGDSGLFWFFGPDNWEVLVKVLDGCGTNNRFWVFAAATTNVEYTLRVTDTETGEVREYFNPLGNAAPAITDTSAFATCSDGS